MTEQLPACGPPQAAPRVSIVLPTYNGERYIREALDSCLRQTFSDFELIAVDDGSTDETPEILQSYGDRRLRVLRHERNRKLPAALNTGFAASRGEYLTWISDDNLLAPDAVRLFVAFLDEHTDADFVYTDYVLIDSAGKEVGWYRIDQPDKIREKNVNSPCFMYRRRVYELLGDYNEQFFLAEDYEYWLRVYKQCTMCHLRTDYPMYYFRLHDASLSAHHKWEAHILAAKLRHKLLGLTWLEYARQMACVHANVAFEAFALGNPGGVRGHSIQALLWDPHWLLNRGFLSITVRSFWPRLRKQGGPPPNS